MSTATRTKPWWDTTLVPPATPALVQAPAEDVDPDAPEPEDAPPADLDVCDVCEGAGSITLWHDPFRPWLTDSGDCTTCGGTGSLSGGAA